MLFPDFHKNISDIIKVLNPFQVLINAVEESKENFRIDVDMRYLNELVHIEVLEESENLLDLDVIAREGKLIARGEYHVGDYPLAKIFKVHEVLFHVELAPVWVKSNHARFRVTNYKIWNKARKKFDLVKIVSRIFPYHKNYLLKELVSLYPHILSLTKLQNEIRLNLNYYFQKAGILNNNVKVHRIDLESNKLILYLRSSVMLRPLVDFFGSSIISIYDVVSQIENLPNPTRKKR
ncbi:MAG: hypothetical protein EBS19_10005 [Spirochaetia bacterium]|nr:hypothetical protein [Spirochaetia bacterium]